MSDIAYLSAIELATAIRERRISSREALTELLTRVDRLNPPINAIVTRDDERAFHEADIADQAIARGDRLGPLHGVPMTVKDSLSTHGMRTTSGAPELSGHIPEADADAVTKVRAAGAVIYGKTNLPIYAGDLQSYNEVFGTTNNPWNVERTCCGSSGGSAAALAAGFTPIEIGSDIGGSIRSPSSTCGIMGHKPSYGIVSARGQIPGPPGTLTQADIAVVGPMARTVDDLEMELDLLAGPDEWMAPGWKLDLAPPRRSNIKDYRIAAWLDDPANPIDSEVYGLLSNAVDALQDAGVTVDRDARPAFNYDYARGVFDQLIAAALCGSYSRDDIERMAEMAKEDPTLRGHANTSQRHREWLTGNERRLQMRRKWHEFFKSWDAIVLPVLPTAAIPHDHSEPMAARKIQINGETRPYGDQTAWVGITGISWLPATVIPVGLTTEGLPVGIQIAGPFLEDRTTLDIARKLSAIIGGCPKPPGY
ncbi:MAG: amidase [Pseudomonadota bacterium]